MLVHILDYDLQTDFVPNLLFLLGMTYYTRTPDNSLLRELICLNSRYITILGGRRGDFSILDA